MSSSSVQTSPTTNSKKRQRPTTDESTCADKKAKNDHRKLMDDCRSRVHELTESDTCLEPFFLAVLTQCQETLTMILALLGSVRSREPVEKSLILLVTNTMFPCTRKQESSNEPRCHKVDTVLRLLYDAPRGHSHVDYMRKRLAKWHANVDDFGFFFAHWLREQAEVYMDIQEGGGNVDKQRDHLMAFFPGDVSNVVKSRRDGANIPK